MFFLRTRTDKGLRFACPYLADLELDYCADGSGWACNEAGLRHIAIAGSGEDFRRRTVAGAALPFGYSCDRGFSAGCRNLKTLKEDKQRVRGWAFIVQRLRHRIEGQ